MRIFATFIIALRALRRNKLRTILTMLGIIIGVCAVIATFSLVNGAKSSVEAQIASLGQNVVLIFSGSQSRGGVHSGWGGAGTLTIDDANAIQKEVVGVISVSPEIRSSSQVSAGNQNWSTLILGESEEYLDIRQWPLADGAMFTPQDVRSGNKVTIIGQTVSKQLFGEGTPIGQIIRVKNVPFIITGLLSAKGLSVQGTDQDDLMVMPYTSAMKRLFGATTLRSITVQVSGPKVFSDVQNQINELLRQRHRIQPGRDDDFTVRTQEEIAAAANATSNTMALLLGGTSLVSLIVGGIGIMNIMLVSVTERTREIGIRMAVGAKGKDILLQFLIEAVTLSLLGGIIGSSLGVLCSNLIAAQMNLPNRVSIVSILVAFGVSFAVGIFFGFYPARKASLLDPIDALRYE